MKNKKSLIVNIYGMPSAGKSTTAAGVFSELKWLNIDCELATEYAKDKVWEGSHNILGNQFFISANQYHRLWRLNGKVDVIITDSPLILGLAYADKEPQEFKDLIVKYYNSFNNLDIFLQRVKPYHTNGRVQTYEEALEKDKQINELFNKYCTQNIAKISGEKESIPKIVDLIINLIKENNIK